MADALDAIPALRRRKGKRGQAREPVKVRPADPAAVEATLPFLAPQLADLVRVLRFTGMRPGEGVLLRPGDIDFGWKEIDGMRIWLYAPGGHKGEWRGLLKWVPIGPRAQAALAPWLDRPAESYCFSPREVREAWCRANGRSTRTGRSRRPGEHYTTQSFDRAVRRAVGRAGVSPWAPNQLRHLAATVIETERPAGRADSQAVLGHTTPQTTAVYAEQVERAGRVMREMG